MPLVYVRWLLKITLVLWQQQMQIFFRCWIWLVAQDNDFLLQYQWMMMTNYILICDKKYLCHFRSNNSIAIIVCIGKTYGKEGELFLLYWNHTLSLSKVSIYYIHILYYLCAITHATKMMPKSASNHRFQALNSLIFYYLL